MSDDTDPNEMPANDNAEQDAPVAATLPGISLDDADALRRGYVRAGSVDWYVEARGDFAEAAVKGYTPTPESDRMRVDLPLFEGPLDLLLHLIEKHALDLLDIPIATITEHYLKSIGDMQALDLELAGEFIVMAAQLAHWKSKLLLPKEDVKADDAEEEEDPREALRRRLMEYQRFKDVAEQLSVMNWLGRDVFPRAPTAKVWNADDYVLDDPYGGLKRFDVMKLIETLDVIMKRSKVRIVHEVTMDRLTVGQRINDVVDFAQERENFTFRDLVMHFGGLGQGKRNIIVTFLAMLEMTKFRLLQLHQAAEDGTIYVTVVKKQFDDDDEVEAYGDELTSKAKSLVLDGALSGGEIV